MTDDQVPMFDELPVTDEPKKKKRKVNDLQESLLYLMEKKGISLSDIKKATNIPWGTLMGWHDGDVNTQMVDVGLFELWRYLGCPLEFLCFGIGDEDAHVDVDLLQENTRLKEENEELKKRVAELEQLIFKVAS